MLKVILVLSVMISVSFWMTVTLASVTRCKKCRGWCNSESECELRRKASL